MGDYNMGYIVLFLIGFGLTVTGGVTLIAYMNFLPAGVSWLEYFLYVSGRLECYFLPIGLVIMTIAIYSSPNKS
jgi:hypothetical protein